MENHVRWGIIGCGDVCEKKSGPAFYKAEHSALTAVMRRDGAKVADFARRHGVPKYYTRAEDLLADPQVDAVYVATPPSTHREYALMAMRAGKPVYVEKPMGMDYAQCTEMLKVSEETGQKLFTAFYRRGLPYFLKVKSLLDGGAVGKVLTVGIRHCRAPLPSDLQPGGQSWRVDGGIAGEGYFYDLAPHTFDILDFLLGEIADACGYAENRGGLYAVKDTVSASFRCKSGAPGTGAWCFVAPESSAEETVEIVGTAGKLCFSVFSFAPIRLVHGIETESYPVETPEHVQQPLIQEVVNDLRGIGQSPSTGANGARTAWVMDRIMGKS